MPGVIDYAQLLTECHSTRFAALRPAQAVLLSSYRMDYAVTRDVAIELPTGAGKSLIALLIGEAWRREDKKVAILTANKTLARQMEGEAAALGIPAVLMEGTGAAIPPADRRRYHRAAAVAIMNYWVYINQNPAIDPADLLIMDDAHLAEHCLHSLYGVDVDRYAHKSLFEALMTELAAHCPDYAVLQDALDPAMPPTTTTQLLSFLDQHAVARRLREIVDASPELETDADLRFRWGRMRDRIEEANLYMSYQSLCFRPYVYPFIASSRYEGTIQCIYMSATIGDTADLARRLGTRPIAKISMPRDLADVTYGRRMLVLNTQDEGDIPPSLSPVILAALRVHPKSVWLCASNAEAARLRAAISEWLNSNGCVGQPTWLLSSMGDEIEEFKRAKAGHLFVAGRFDGMDFNADECRLVVLASLPRAVNPQEEFFTAYLRDASFMLRRLNQRIVQALGRCNRAEDDFAVYVLADRRFVTHFGRESHRVGLPRAIMAEVDAAEDAADLGPAANAVRVESFLRGDFTAFDGDLAEHMEAIPAERSDGGSAAGDADASEDEVLGSTALFESHNYSAAEKKFAARATVTRAAELGAYYQWLEAKAAFLAGEQGDVAARGRALDLLTHAIERGEQSSWFNRLRSSVNRHLASSGRSIGVLAREYSEAVVRAFDDRLERVGTRGTSFQRWIDRVGGLLTSTNHGSYQEGLAELGIILGYVASRPKGQAATDALWRGVFGNVRECVTFEVKIEHDPTGQIAPKDVGQAHNQEERARRQYGTSGYTIRTVIVTHLGGLEPAATSSLGDVRIVPAQTVLALWRRVVEVFASYRDHWSLDDVEARQVAADLLQPRLPPAGWLTRALATDEPTIPADTLLGEWPWP